MTLRRRRSVSSMMRPSSVGAVSNWRTSAVACAVLALLFTDCFRAAAPGADALVTRSVNVFIVNNRPGLGDVVRILVDDSVVYRRRVRQGDHGHRFFFFATDAPATSVLRCAVRDTVVVLSRPIDKTYYMVDINRRDTSALVTVRESNRGFVFY